MIVRKHNPAKTAYYMIHREYAGFRLFELSISCVHFICFRFCLHLKKLALVCEEIRTKTPFTPLLSDINNGSSNTKILLFWSVNQRCTYSYELKQNTQSTLWCLGWLLTMVPLCLHFVSHLSSLSTW